MDSHGVLDVTCSQNTFSLKHYDPETGSWLSPDPVKDGLNWYQYCGSNPVSRVDPLGLVPYAAAQQNRPEPSQEHYAPGENLREGGFYDRLGCEEKKVIWQYQQAFTSHNAGLAYEFFYFGYISGMPDPAMADQIGVLMAKLFSGGYEINEREFIRGREDMNNALMLVGLVMLLNGAVGAVKGSALGGNLQYAMAGGGTMDATMAITAENAMVIAALNSMYPDTSNDGIIRRIEGESNSYKKYEPKEIEKKYGLKKGEFHREVKPDILSDLTNKNSPYKDLMKKMGNNPDIYLSSNGQIEIVSTQFKGKSFVTDLNIADFLP